VGAGRKRKPVSEKQSELIGVKLTPKERRALESVAEGERLSAYVRRLILRHLARRRK
jgi:hypothetical protein